MHFLIVPGWVKICNFGYFAILCNKNQIKLHIDLYLIFWLSCSLNNNQVQIIGFINNQVKTLLRYIPLLPVWMDTAQCILSKFDTAQITLTESKEFLYIWNYFALCPMHRLAQRKFWTQCDQYLQLHSAYFKSLEILLLIFYFVLKNDFHYNSRVWKLN